MRQIPRAGLATAERMFSIIICSHREERYAASARHYETLFSGHPHELIRIPDAASLCEGYARGLATAKGDFLVFSHDDVEFVCAGVPERLVSHLATFDLVGIAGTTRLIDGAWSSSGDPHCFALVVYPGPDGLFDVKCVGTGGLSVPGIQALDGCFLACRRVVAETVGFDAATFDGFHLYDLDFSFRAYLAGFRLAVCRDLALIHASRGNPDATWSAYRQRFERKHRGALATGPTRHVREVRARLPRDRLTWFCEPSGIELMIRRLGESTAPAGTAP